MATATTTERRRRLWTCSGCAVEVRNASGEPIPEPPGWTDDDLCLACQRKEADREGGSDAVLRFELLRGAPLKKAAKRASVTVESARSTRAQMVKRGEVAPLRKKEKGQPRVAQAEVVEAELRRTPEASSREVADRVGASVRTVTRTRKRLGGASDEEQRRQDDFERLRDHPGGQATTAEFAGLLDRSRSRAGARLVALVEAGLATCTVRAQGRGRTKVYRATPQGPPADP